MSAAEAFYGSAEAEEVRQWIGVATIGQLASARTPRHQAPLHATRVRRYADNFDPLKFGVPEVRIDRSGTWWLEDGQHRVAAAVRAGKSGLQVNVQFTAGVDDRQAAEIYIGVNDRKMKPVGAVVMARAEAGDPIAAAIFEIAERNGFRIKLLHTGTNVVDNIIRCPDKLVKMVDAFGPQHVDCVLRVVRLAWDGKNDSTQRDILVGISQFIAVYPEIELRDLAEKLATVAPKAIIGEIAAARVAERSTSQLRSGYAPGRGVLQVWNHQRKSRRMDDAFNDFDVTRRRALTKGAK